MAVGRKTRFQAKLHRREVKKELYKADLIKTIGLIFIVGLIASSILVYIITIIYPVAASYIKKAFKSYRFTSVNPYLKKNLQHEDFKHMYLQKEPVLFPSLQTHTHTEAIWNHFEIICNQERREHSHPLQCRHEDTCQNNEGSNSPIIFNFSSSSNIRNLVHAPQLASHDNGTKVLTNLRGSEIRLELLLPDNEWLPDSDDETAQEPLLSSSSGGSGSGGFRTFRQQGQGWSELIVGRKKWFLYRPGKTLRLYVVGF
jgi:hypothetical protein